MEEKKKDYMKEKEVKRVKVRSKNEMDGTRRMHLVPERRERKLLPNQQETTKNKKGWKRKRKGEIDGKKERADFFHEKWFI